MPPGKAADRAAFRHLLRLARQVDGDPLRQAVVVGRPPRRYDARHGRAVQMKFGGSPFAEDAVCGASGGCTEFSHPEPRAAPRAVRGHYGRSEALGLPYQAEAKYLTKRLQAACSLADELGMLGRRKLEDPLALPGGDGALGIRRLRPQDAACGVPSAGDLLLTHPMSCLFESTLDQAVVLLTGAGRDTLQVDGLVLNKPVGATLGQMVDKWQHPRDREWASSLCLGPLLESRLYRGGPITRARSLQESLQWLHRFGEGVPGCRRIAPGVFLGGDLNVIAGRALEDPSGVRVFLGHAGWAPLQLRIELECGVWVRGLADDETAPAQDSDGVGSTAGGGHDSPRGGGVGDGRGFGGVLDALCFGQMERAQSWKEAMVRAGLGGFARFPRSPGVDRRLRGYIDRVQHGVNSEEPLASAVNLQESGVVSPGTGRALGGGARRRRGA